MNFDPYSRIIHYVTKRMSGKVIVWEILASAIRKKKKKRALGTLKLKRKKQNCLL